jgi:aspartate/methionine/tyrosine aminotransferase
MKIEPFALERYFAEHEFEAAYLLGSSDCETMSMAELLELADDDTKEVWGRLRLGYTESAGLPLLREEVAGLYEGVSADDVLVVAPEEGIFVAMNCLLNKGDHAVSIHPAYQSLFEVAAAIGCRVDRWEPDEAAGWRFDVGTIESLVRPDTRAIMVSFPHNPTGSLPAREEFEKLVGLAADRGIALFSDEMYRFLELDPAARLPSACEISDSAVALFGMSKTFGLAGLRVGWLATRDKALLQRMRRFKDYTTICSSAPSEVLAVIAMRSRNAIAERNMSIIRSNLELLDDFFARQSERFSWVRPPAGSVCFPRMLFDEAAREFAARAVSRAGVMVVPSEVFGCESHLRMGFGRKNMPEALARFETFLESDG